MTGGPIGQGCEPYSFDFGDREYEAWLREHLSEDEYEQRATAWSAYRRLDDRVRKVLAPIRYTWAYRLVQRVVTWRRQRAWGRFDLLAKERGGEPPGPSWKVRTEFGVPGGGSR